MLAPLAAGVGCTAPGATNVERGFDPARSGSALVVFSATITAGFPGAYWYQIERTPGNGAGAIVSVPVQGAGVPLDWSGVVADGESFSGRVAAIELAPGDYTLRRLVAAPGLGLPTSQSARLNGDFRVLAGEVVYLGNVHTSLEREAITNRLPYRVVVTDRGRRDLGILAKSHGEALAARARTSIVRVDAGGDPRFGSSDTTINDLKGLLKQ